MPMTNKGLSKLLEECGELVQIAAKKLAYIDTDEHPDGAGSMAARMEEEMADVQASIEFVRAKLGLNKQRIGVRRAYKLKKFQQWDADPNS